MLMNARSLIPCLALAAAAVAPAARADVFTVSIDAKIYSGLGDCGTATSPSGQGACDGTVAIGINDGTNAINGGGSDWGIGLPFDLLRLQALKQMVDTTALQSFTDTVDFAVGDTGGGSAGPEGGSLLHPVSLERTVSIIGSITTQSYTLIQTGMLQVGWDVDAFVLNPADLTVTLDGGTQVTLHFDGISSWAIDTQPTALMGISVSAVPELPAVAMYGVGLAGLLAWRRRQSRLAA